MTKGTLNTLKLAGFTLLAATAANVATAAPHAANVAPAGLAEAAYVSTTGKLMQVSAFRIRRYRRNYCWIHRHRVRHPVTGNWIFINHKHCPTTGTLAPRS